MFATSIRKQPQRNPYQKPETESERRVLHSSTALWENYKAVVDATGTTSCTIGSGHSSSGLRPGHNKRVAVRHTFNHDVTSSMGQRWLVAMHDEWQTTNKELVVWLASGWHRWHRWRSEPLARYIRFHSRSNTATTQCHVINPSEMTNISLSLSLSLSISLFLSLSISFLFSQHAMVLISRERPGKD